MVGLEPTRLAPLPPQDSVSTNSTTSATNQLPSASVDGAAGSSAGEGRPEAGASPAGSSDGSAGGKSRSCGSLGTARDPPAGILSRILSGCCCSVEKYASARLVTKNVVASSAVVLDRKFAEPRAPKTVPDAPAPKPVPASAPLPRCRSTSPTIIRHTSICNIKTIV